MTEVATIAYLVFGLKFVYIVLTTLLDIVLMNRKNTAQQLIYIYIYIYIYLYLHIYKYIYMYINIYTYI